MNVFSYNLTKHVSHFIATLLLERKILMNMIPVSSSNLSAVGYENGILYIRFHGGQMYCYYGVPEFVYEELMSAPSHGKYFAANIRNVYRYQKL